MLDWAGSPTGPEVFARVTRAPDGVGFTVGCSECDWRSWAFEIAFALSEFDAHYNNEHYDDVADLSPFAGDAPKPHAAGDCDCPADAHVGLY